MSETQNDIPPEEMAKARNSLSKYGLWVAGDTGEQEKQGVSALAMMAAALELQLLNAPDTARVTVSRDGIRIEPATPASEDATDAPAVEQAPVEVRIEPDKIEGDFSTDAPADG